MNITAFDHIVLSCHSVADTVAFYRDVLGLRTGEERPGKWAIWFGDNKISLQDEANKPPMAINTLPGTGNFCVVTETPVDEIAEELTSAGVEILALARRMHQDYRHSASGNELEAARIVAQRGDVVDQVRARGQRGFHHRRTPRVDANRGAHCHGMLDRRHDALDLVAFPHRGRARPIALRPPAPAHRAVGLARLRYPLPWPAPAAPPRRRESR